MIVLGLLLILAGWILPGFQLLVTIGVVLVIIGAVLLLARPGGRRYY